MYIDFFNTSFGLIAVVHGFTSFIYLPTFIKIESTNLQYFIQRPNHQILIGLKESPAQWRSPELENRPSPIENRLL